MIDLMIKIGDKKMSYPKVDEDRFEDNVYDYLTIAKKTINKFAPNAYKRTLLSNEDCVSNIAHQIMMADWRWDKNYKSKEGRTKTKYSYRNQCAIWSILSTIEKISKSKNNLSLSFALTEDNFDLTDVLKDDKQKTPEDVLEDKERSYVVSNILSDEETLSEKQINYLKLYFIDGLTYEAIGKMHNNITREAVRQYIERAIKKVRKKGYDFYATK